MATNWLDDKLGGALVQQNGGTPLPKRGKLNVIGATIEDNPQNDSVDMTITDTGAAGAAVDDLTALRGIGPGDRVAKQRRAVRTPATSVVLPGGFVFIPDRGGGVADDSLNVVKPADLLTAQNGRWFRDPPLYEFSVESFGAVGNDDAVDNAGAIQAATDYVAALGGGVVTFTAGKRYRVASTIFIGAADTPVTGVIWESKRRSLLADRATLWWDGTVGSDSHIVEIREAHSCELKRLGFDGNNAADYCVQWHLVSGDSLQVEHFDCQGLYFINARTYNVLIGEPDGSPSAGDVSMVQFHNCYFQQSNMGAETVAHVRHRSVNALNNSFINCQFYGTGTPLGGPEGFPSYGISIGSGRVVAIGCIATVLGIADIFMDNDTGVAPGNIHAISWESQSRQLLKTATVDDSAAIRSTVLEDCFHNDILNSHTTYAIEWGLHGNAGLHLIGCNISANGGGLSGGKVRITSPLANVYTHGTNFDHPSGGFFGYVERVQGTYRDGNGVMQSQHTQTQTDSWGVDRQTAVSAVLHGSGSAPGTIADGEYVDISVNGTDAIRTTFASVSTINDVINQINTAFGGIIIVQADPDSAFAELRFQVSQSIEIVGGSTGTVGKLGLTVGITSSDGVFPVAVLEGKQFTMNDADIVDIGDEQLSGFLTAVFHGGVADTADCAMFQLTGRIHTTTITMDPSATYWSNTKDTTSHINIYYDGTAARYQIQNKLGSTLAISLSFTGIGQH